jgi:MFS family permease
VTAVVAPDLIDELALSAEDLGLLTAVFFLVFAAAQLPAGVLLDRYGARVVTTVLFVIAGAGALMFALADALPALALGRALMGLGMSVALMGGFKALVEWLPRERLPFGNGLLLMAGGLGTMSATAPVQWALGLTDWRGVFVILTVSTAVVAGGLLTAAPEKPRGSTHPTMIDALKGVGRIVRDANFLRCAPLGGIVMGVSISVTSLWAGPWLRDVVELPRAGIANVLFGMAATMTLSVVVTGALVERLRRAGLPALLTACIGIVGFIAAQGAIVADPPVSPYALWLPLAFFGTAPVLIYTVLMDGFPPAFAGRVNTAYNFVTFGAAFAAQWGFGAIIDLWPPVADGRFAPAGYRTALGVMVAVELIAFAWLIAGRRLTVRR